MKRQRAERGGRRAETLAARYARAEDIIRIDVIFIVPRRWPRHVENVWRG